MHDTLVILASMTIAEAIEHLPDREKTLLKRWGETFDITLAELHWGHIVTYQKERREETDSRTINLEVKTLLDLIRRLQLNKEIDESYLPLPEKKPDDGRCLHRETFVKKDGTLSKITRQCTRQAEIHRDGFFMQFCAEHQREFNETFLRVMDRKRTRSSFFMPGPKMVQ